MWNLAPQNMFDEYQEEDERRRRALQMDPTPQATLETPASATNSMVPTLSPAQQRYKDVLSALPQQGDYQPSKWRRFGAALAGGLAGLRNPEMGVNVAHGIVSAPYTEALGSWERAVGAEGKAAGIEQQAITTDINRRRALAAEQTARARGRTAASTEAYNQARVRNMLTPEQQLEKSKIEHQPTWTDPNYVAGYKSAHPWEAPSVAAGIRGRTAETVANIGAKSRETAAGIGASARRYAADQQLKAAQLRASIKKQGTPATPAQFAEAERLAAETVIRTNPAYTNFYTPTVPGEAFGRVKSMAELGFDKPAANAQESLAREQYRQFLSEVKKQQAGILGSRTPQAPEDEDDGSDWDLLEEDDEEEDQ